MPNSETREAIKLAMANEGRITHLIGVGSGGSNRDIPLNLSVEQSKAVYEAILGTLKD